MDDRFARHKPDARFVRTTRAALSPQDRTQLVRRGNEFFNNGNIDAAKRIFLTVHYTDGLIRLGDYYHKKNDFLEAFRMYWLAPDQRRVEQLAEKMAGVVRKWLSEDESSQAGSESERGTAT